MYETGGSKVKGAKTLPPFPVMSVMNATTVITNSREAREPSRKNTTPFFVKIIPLDHKTLWFITNPLDCTWPSLCIYIRPIFTEDRGLIPPAPFDYWHIGLSDCFERSLQIQISFNTSISIILPQIFRKYLYGNKNIANKTSCLYKRIVTNSNVLLLLKGKLGISDFVVVLRVR